MILSSTQTRRKGEENNGVVGRTRVYLREDGPPRSKKRRRWSCGRFPRRHVDLHKVNEKKSHNSENYYADDGMRRLGQAHVNGAFRREHFEWREEEMIIGRGEKEVKSWG